MPHLPAGIRARMALFLSGLSINSVFISVLIYPGAMALTEMPLDIHSFDRALVSWATPPFDAAYAGTVMPPWNERRDATLMMVPLRPDWKLAASRDRRYAPNSRHNVKTDVKLTWRT
ncbi:hypothetical protein ACKS0A_01954 [Histoplasma ohiense]